MYIENSGIMERLMMFVSLMLAFVMGTWAEEANNLNIVSQDTHATGIDKDNGVVYLNDLENHNWTYYSGVDVGNYNRDYAGKLYSPNPRNVKITYNGGGIQNAGSGNANAAVGIDASETSFVYFKTLEKDGDGYPYTTIANPFSKRPSRVSTNNAGESSKQFYGFAGWKVVKMAGCTLRGSDSTTYSTAEGYNIIPAETELIISLTEGRESAYETARQSNPTLLNHISAEIELQATWTPLNNIVRLTSTTSSSYNYTAEGGTYETNILVLQTNLTQHIVAMSPCTVMMVEPDGSNDYRDDYMFNKLLRPAEGVNNRTKIEYVHWQPSGSINARGRNFTIGRGIVMDGTPQAIYGILTDPEPVNHTLKVESGKFTQFIHYGQLPTSITKQWITLGCDYDRANRDNNNLEFTSDLRVAKDMTLPTDEDSEIFRTYSLSGKFVTGQDVANAAAASCYYLSVRDGADQVLGHRYLEILGGEWKNLAGGWSPDHPENKRSLTIRIKGGNIKGSIYGGAQHVEASGIVTYIITGGTINGWVAGGANGTTSDRGELFGSSFIYVGGNARIDSNGSTTLINRAVGGNVFGAGCGYDAESESGQVTLGTNVVIADNAYVERGVYGGGSYGYTENTSNIYITGGNVGGNVGGVEATGETKAYTTAITGGVYGGACQNKGGSVNIYMTGGMVNGGLYGGSNASGTLSGNVNIKITGGTIGGILNGNQTNANVYGGGYGSGTAVNGAVSMTLGNSGSSTVATVNGDVYGGGAEGKVNNSISINVNAVNINGDLYGGGHGASAEVSGNSAITMTGGTIGNVFGGGNAAKLIGNSSVTITDGTVTSNVYGGGNQAAVSGTTNVVIGRSNDQQNSSN